jgi:hypothetical protein
LLGRILLVVYGLVFVFGVVLVNCKDVVAGIVQCVSNAQEEKDLRQCRREEDACRRQNPLSVYRPEDVPPAQADPEKAY